MCVTTALLFASGWYIDVDQFTKDIVTGVVDLFNSVGLEAMVESLSSNPGNILGGVAESAVSYNASGAVEGEWSVFIADSSGNVVLHFNPAMIGTRIEDLLGADASAIDEEGVWLTSESMRIWAVKSDGWVFGAGWRNDRSRELMGRCRPRLPRANPLCQGASEPLSQVQYGGTWNDYETRGLATASSPSSSTSNIWTGPRPWPGCESGACWRGLSVSG